MDNKYCEDCKDYPACDDLDDDTEVFDCDYKEVKKQNRDMKNWIITKIKNLFKTKKGGKNKCYKVKISRSLKIGG